MQHAHVSIENWRLLFIIEGIPTVLLGLLVTQILPGRPEETSFLDDKERKLQLERMNRGTGADYGRTLNKRHIVAAFCDWRVSLRHLLLSEVERPHIIRAGICRRRHLLWVQLCVSRSNSLPSYNLEHFWLLYVTSQLCRPFEN